MASIPSEREWIRQVRRASQLSVTQSALAVCCLACSVFTSAVAEPSSTGEPDPLTASCRLYSGLQTYQDVMFISTEMSTGAVDLASQTLYQGFISFSFARPNKIAYVTDTYSMLSDGKTLWLVDHLNRQYVRSAAPDRIETDGFLPVAQMGNLRRHLPSVMITSQCSSPTNVLPGLQIVSGSVGEDCCVAGSESVQALLPAESSRVGIPLRVRFCVAEASALLTEISVDVSDLYPAECHGSGSVARVVVRMVFSDMRVDRAIDDATFRFAPSEGWVRVEGIRVPGGEALHVGK